MSMVLRLLVLFLVLTTNIWANPETSSWYAQDEQKHIHLNVDLFLSSTCPHCHKANEFFTELEQATPWLHIQLYFIDQDKKALIRFNQLLTEQKMNDFAVPSIFFCNSRWVGFASAKTTGKDLLQAMNYCKQQIEKKNSLTATTINVLQQKANANLFDSAMIETPSITYYVLTMAFMDAFNPCSLFCLVGFFIFLMMQIKRRHILIVGFLYILAVSLTHFIEQTQLNTFYNLFPWLRILDVLIGVMSLLFVWLHYEK
ncbi:MAG: hypothetical protein PSV35_04515, partial [bacterium]|nr:hypothetical protein [bacterium]